MAKQTELDKLKARLDLNDDKQNGKLLVLLEDATDDVLAYTNQKEVKPGMESSIRELAIIKYNQIGNEGETSRSEGGISHSFEVGIPRRICIKLNKYRVGKLGRLL